MRKSALSVFLIAFPACLATLQLSPTTRPATNSVLGKENTELTAILGPPKRISGQQGTQTWSWRGGSHRDVVVCAGRVVHVDPTFDLATWKARPIPAIGAYVGQPVAQLLARMGNPGQLKWVGDGLLGAPPPTLRTSAPEPGSTYLVYGKTWVGIGGDVVTVVRAAIPDRKKRGPGR